MHALLSEETPIERAWNELAEEERRTIKELCTNLTKDGQQKYEKSDGTHTELL